ncbi:hypothetical protein C0991_000098 [Blastosporella zonata]|nr:hypothetical protein C0991_000098 [Blastosporella zonata]
MSVLLRRSLCLSCPRSTLARSFSSTPLFLRPEAITNGATKLKKTRKSKEKDPELTGPPTRNLLEESKLQEFLDNLASKQDISLKDFEREYKPFRRPGKGEPNYENEYNKVVERLLRSFSLVQLRNLVQLYDIDTPGKISKRRAAAMIIEDKWRWPSPTSIRQENSDAETIYETFPLDAKHAFLILGKDGTHLLDLSAKFGVHVSFSSKPFSLKAEGSRASLRTLGEYIDEFKKGIREEYFQPTLLENVDADSLQRISRVSGVFAENAGNGLVRLTYKDCDERAASFAQRLILRTATEVKESIPALIYSAPIQTTSTLDQPHPTYSLYPFLPSQPKAQISRQQNLFRVRRVGDWLRSGMNNMNEGNPTSSLADVACATDFSGNSVDFRHALLAQDNGLDVDENEPSTRLTASFGHFLVSCESSNQSSIKPPLSGSQELSKVLEWFRSNESKSVFAPSLPHSLINCAPTKQRLVHRVVYRSSSATETCVENLLKFELVLDALNSNPFAPAKLEANDSSEQPNNPFKMVPTCSAESSRHLDLLLPDRHVPPD